MVETARNNRYQEKNRRDTICIAEGVGEKLDLCGRIVRGNIA